MRKTKTMILLFLSALLASTNAAFEISVYGDVLKDVEFFTRTFPWIIDNIGGEILVDYSLIGSGRYSVPQMCALENLKLNTFLQAQYLKCEAEGKPSGYCLCEAGIDSKIFQQCVASGGYLASSASAKFSELGINFTPIIELKPNNTVYGVEDIWFLEKTCTIFGDKLPRGCVNYSNQTESFPAKKALAQFDRACLKEFPISDEHDESITTTPRTTQTTPTPWWSTTSTPWVTHTLPWPTTSTQSPPWSTTSPPWWSTTSTERPTTHPWGTTWPTTSPPWWWTTAPPWSTTSTQSPPWSTTSTQSPPWSTTSTQSPPWSTTSTQSPPWSTIWSG